MTIEQIGEVAEAINSIYPNSVPITQASIAMWFALLGNYKYEEVIKSLQECLVTMHFAPKPADIIANIGSKTKTLGPNEAWSLVYKAICNSTYNSVKEFEKLPEDIQKAVGSAENLRAMAMDESFNMGVEQSHFVRQYSTVVERKQKENMFKLTFGGGEDVERIESK